MMISRTVLFVLVVVLLAACGQESVASGGDPQQTDDATVTNEQPVTNATSDPGGPPVGGTVTGVVVNGAGQPVNGVVIEAKSLDQPPQAIPEMVVVTDAQGRYMWPLKPGRYELAARAADRSSSTAQVVVTAGETAQANLTVG
jgi:hypothetical protein